MDPLYRPVGVEERWQRIWEDERLFHADPEAPGEAYVIDCHVAYLDLLDEVARKLGEAE